MKSFLLCYTYKPQPPTTAAIATATRPPHFNVGDEKEGGVQVATMPLNSPQPLQLGEQSDHRCRWLLGAGHQFSDEGGHWKRSRESTRSRAFESFIVCRNKQDRIQQLDMFPGSTEKEPSQAQDRFADDASHRVQAEADQISRKCGTDTQKMKQLAAKAVAAIHTCYTGDHGPCMKLSPVCVHNGKYNFPHLSRYVRSRLMITEKDAQLLKMLLGKRLGDEAIEETKVQNRYPQV